MPKHTTWRKALLFYLLIRLFLCEIINSRDFHTGKREQYERQLEDLWAEHAKNDQTINGLIDSLGMLSESVAKPRILKRIEELSDLNRDAENYICELEGLINVNALSVK